MNDSPRSNPPEDLPYRVELWHDGDARGGIERVLARASSVQLARAIFRAAREEHPQRRLTLSQGDQIVEDSQRT
jgi:hypothetical protein